MSSGDKVKLHITVKTELYNRFYAHRLKTGEPAVAVLERALEREFSIVPEQPTEKGGADGSGSA